VGLFTTSGGMGILMADEAAAVGLEVPTVPADVQAELKEIWPPAGVGNPVDLTAQAMNSDTLLGDFADVVLRGKDYDALVMALTYMGRLEPWTDLVVTTLRRVRESHPTVPLFVAMLSTPEVRSAVEELGISVFADVSDAVRAAGRLAGVGRVAAAAEAVTPVAATALPEGGAATEVSAKAVLAAAGVPVVQERLVTSAAEAAAAAEQAVGAVAMKIVSPDILHKTEVDGVALDVRGAAAAAAAYARIDEAARTACPDARIEGVVVAPMVTDGVETILGAFNDPTFGPVVMFGLGGVFVEVLQDVTYRLAPFGPETAREMVREVRGFAVLDGARGRPPVDLDALAAALSALSHFAAAHRDVLDGVEVNPFLARPRGLGGVAVDALITMREG
jgi:acyl-CoA synthetase (NDP forming)